MPYPKPVFMLFLRARWANQANRARQAEVAHPFTAGGGTSLNAPGYDDFDGLRLPFRGYFGFSALLTLDFPYAILWITRHDNFRFSREESYDCQSC